MSSGWLNCDGSIVQGQWGEGPRGRQSLCPHRAVCAPTSPLSGPPAPFRDRDLRRRLNADCVERLRFSVRSQLWRPLSRLENFWLGERHATAVLGRRSSPRQGLTQRRTGQAQRQSPFSTIGQFRGFLTDPSILPVEEFGTKDTVGRILRLRDRACAPAVLTSPAASGEGRPSPRQRRSNRAVAQTKSGRRSRVIRSACALRHAAILAWSPDSRISGIGRPSHSRGRV